MMKTGVPPTHRYPSRSKLGRHNSSQEPKVEDKAKDRVFVPKEVIFNILLFLPAKLLHDVVRYVCKQWYDIITDSFFVRAHCQMPTTTNSDSFIVQAPYTRHNMYFVVHEDVAKSVMLTKIQLPFRGMIQGSCNGLVLFCDNWDTSRKVHLMNPLRKLIVNMPPVIPVVLGYLFYTTYGFAVNSSGQYKVVHISFYISPTYSCEMSVFTIGVDKSWRPRPIDLQHLLGTPLNYGDMPCPLWNPGLLIARFLYWCSTSFVYSLAMDVDTETLYLITWPASVDRERFNRYFISMGTALGLMAQDDSNPAIWKLLKLTDIKSSEWTEISKIDIGAIVNKVTKGKWTMTYGVVAIKPVSLIHGELCFYCGVISTKWSRFVRYNLANESLVSSRVNISCNGASSVHHVQTFVSPKNCYP
ncbi:uncharacterized protein LOC141655771 [Silene latifolia]|uniref:uncharacterized protein LOC141655771 n=1 Tax=Silene latifolia TaxID=37657 RepID=UPI003D77F3AD